MPYDAGLATLPAGIGPVARAVVVRNETDVDANPLSIAILGTRGLPPRYGGRETATDEIGRRLAERGHEIVVYSRYSNSTPPRPRSHRGMRLVHLPSLSGKTLDSPSHLVASSLHLTLREKADIVVLSDIGTSFVIPWLHLFGRKVVWWVDGPAWLRGKWGPMARAYLRGASWLGVRRCDAMVCDTTVAQRYYRRTEGRDSVFIPYGATVETSSGRATLDRFGLTEDGYVLFVGRLTPEKGVSLLIDAFESLATDRKLVIVGDNPYDKAYVAQLRATSDARVVFTGYQFDEAFHELMQHCCVYVQPSEVEGTSPVVLSAMGHGRAVLVNGIEENLETVGDGGLAFARNDVDDLRGALSALLEDPTRRQQIGERARRRVEQVYNWDRITDQFERVFHDLAAGRPVAVG